MSWISNIFHSRSKIFPSNPRFARGRGGELIIPAQLFLNVFVFVDFFLGFVRICYRIPGVYQFPATCP